jgi:hypothetical protein
MFLPVIALVLIHLSPLTFKFGPREVQGARSYNWLSSRPSWYAAGGAIA